MCHPTTGETLKQIEQKLHQALKLSAPPRCSVQANEEEEEEDLIAARPTNASCTQMAETEDDSVSTGLEADADRQLTPSDTNGQVPLELDSAVHSNPLNACRIWEQAMLTAALNMALLGFGPWLANPFLPGLPANQMLSGRPAKWHRSAGAVGSVSPCGHIFTRLPESSPTGLKVIVDSHGAPVQLSSLCMIYDDSLRKYGSHVFTYHILSGELGPADGAGFVFDNQLRRSNIQNMSSVFLNQRGRICFRSQRQVYKLGLRLPPLEAGRLMTLMVDLDQLRMQFSVYEADGLLAGSADIGMPTMLEHLAPRRGEAQLQSGFFCAVVTKGIRVSLS